MASTTKAICSQNSRRTCYGVRVHHLGSSTRERPDPEVFTREILPLLQSTTLPQMRAATGLSTTMCARIRRGYVPHPRHWGRLRSLSERLGQIVGWGDALAIPDTCLRLGPPNVRRAGYRPKRAAERRPRGRRAVDRRRRELRRARRWRHPGPSRRAGGRRYRAGVLHRAGRPRAEPR